MLFLLALTLLVGGMTYPWLMVGLDLFSDKHTLPTYDRGDSISLQALGFSAAQVSQLMSVANCYKYMHQLLPTHFHLLARRVPTTF